MLRFYDYAVTFAEIPDEISLCIDITNCPCHCPGCHSKHLWQDIGEYLTNEKLDELIKEHPYITCICLMGGDSEQQEIFRVHQHISSHYPTLKLAFYSGKDFINPQLFDILDYYKIGRYIEGLPLTNKNTNQALFKKVDNHLENITYRFQKSVDKNI